MLLQFDLILKLQTHLFWQCRDLKMYHRFWIRSKHAIIAIWTKFPDVARDTCMINLMQLLYCSERERAVHSSKRRDFFHSVNEYQTQEVAIRRAEDCLHRGIIHCCSASRRDRGIQRQCMLYVWQYMRGVASNVHRIARETATTKTSREQFRVGFIKKFTKHYATSYLFSFFPFSCLQPLFLFFFLFCVLSVPFPLVFSLSLSLVVVVSFLCSAGRHVKMDVIVDKFI